MDSFVNDLRLREQKQKLKDDALQTELILTPSIVAIGASYAIVTGVFLSLGGDHEVLINKTYLYMSIALFVLLCFLYYFRSNVSSDVPVLLVFGCAMVACAVAVYEEWSDFVSGVSYNNLLKGVLGASIEGASFHERVGSFLGKYTPIIVWCASLVDFGLRQLTGDANLANLAPYKTHFVALMASLLGLSYAATLLGSSLFVYTKTYSEDITSRKMYYVVMTGGLVFLMFIFRVMFGRVIMNTPWISPTTESNMVDLSEHHRFNRETTERINSTITVWSIPLFVSLIAPMAFVAIIPSADSELVFSDVAGWVFKIIVACSFASLFLFKIHERMRPVFDIIMALSTLVVLNLVIKFMVPHHKWSVMAILALSGMLLLQSISHIRRSKKHEHIYTAIGFAGLYTFGAVVNSYFVTTGYPELAYYEYMRWLLQAGVFYLIFGKACGDMDSFYIILALMFMNYETVHNISGLGAPFSIKFDETQVGEGGWADPGAYLGLFLNTMGVYVVARGVSHLMPDFTGSALLTFSMAAMATYVVPYLNSLTKN